MNHDRKTNIGPYPITTASYRWVPSLNSGQLPDGLVPVGQLETGQVAYVGRMNMEDQMASGFFLLETREIHIPYGCSEHVRQNFDMLVVDDQGSLHWERCSDGKQRPNTVSIPVDVGGQFRETLQVGRTCGPLDEGITLEGHQLELSRHALFGPRICRGGKIHPSHGCLYIPYNGKEYIFRTHEMLMLKPSPESLQNVCRWTIQKRLQNNFAKAVDELPIPSKLKVFLKANVRC